MTTHDTSNKSFMEKEININKDNKKKKKKNRCAFKGCKKKLGMVPFECKCGFKFCTEHRLPEFHKCTFNFKEEGKNILTKNNPVIINDKMIKI